MQTILGATGQIAVELARELARNYAPELRLVSRNPRKVSETDEVVAANLLDAQQTTAAVKGSDVGYFTAGLPPDAYGQTWHLPCDDERLTYKQFVALAADVFGQAPEYSIIGSLAMKVVGLFKKEVREISELLPRYKQDNLFDSSKFKRRFPDFAVTIYRDGLCQIQKQAKAS